MIEVENVSKRFTIHSRQQDREVFADVNLTVRSGECVALDGPSGIGKSTLLRAIYGNYLVSSGSIYVRSKEGLIDVGLADAGAIIGLRQTSLGYVSQFLKVLPRVSTLDVVAQPLIALNWQKERAVSEAAALLARLNVSAELWQLPPLTFSGGEQQRVNIARGFISRHPIMLLDEPTASLDRVNRSVVISLIREAVANGAAILGIFHDEEVRNLVATRVVDVRQFAHTSVQ